MKNNKEKKRTRRFSRKTVMFLLILLSFAMSTSTFAYWAGNVEGAFNSHTMTFTVGSTTYQDYEFVLYSEYDEGELLIDNDFLVDYNSSTGESYDVIFGLLWEDDTIVNEDGSTTTARIEIDYEVYAESNGKELNKNKYKQINRVLDITFDEDNPIDLTLNSTTASFNMNIATNDSASRNDYRQFDKSDIMIIVTYTIIYETTN